MSFSLCGIHVGSDTIEDGAAEAWRDPHPTVYKTSPSTQASTPFPALGNRACGRSQLPSGLSIAWQSVTSLQGASYAQLPSQCQWASEPPPPTTPPCWEQRPRPTGPCLPGTQH